MEYIARILFLAEVFAAVAVVVAYAQSRVNHSLWPQYLSWV